MASKKPSHLLIQRSLKALIIASLFISSSANAGGGGHGGGDNSGHGGSGTAIDKAAGKFDKMEGSFSPEQMDAMRTSQHLANLTNPNFQISEFAYFFFEQKGKKSVPILMEHLKDNEDDAKTVSATIYAIGRLRENGSRAVQVLMRYMKHQDMEIRKTTIAALGKIGRASEPAVQEITRYLESEDEWMRTIALRALKDIKTPQSTAIASQYEKMIALREKRAAGIKVTDDEQKAAEEELQKVKDAVNKKDRKPVVTEGASQPQTTTKGGS